jgi:hypothetical protein
MALRLRLVIWAVFAVALCATAHPEDVEKAAISKCFQSYKQSILEGNGRDALQNVDDKSVEYYADMLELARHGGKDEIKKYGIVDQMIILRIRLEFSPDTIMALNAEKLFIYGVDNGWIGENSVLELSIGEITVLDSTAKAQMVTRGVTVPIYFHFSKEDGEWKFSLRNVIVMAEDIIRDIHKKSGRTEEDFIFYLLEYTSGKEVSDDIWLPVGK